MHFLVTTSMSFPLVGNLSETPERLGIPNAFGTMTKSDNNATLLMTVLVAISTCEELRDMVLNFRIEINYLYFCSKLLSDCNVFKLLEAETSASSPVSSRLPVISILKL
jgi:hypothetical protein